MLFALTSQNSLYYLEWVYMHKRQGCVSTFSFKIRYRAWIGPSPVTAFATKSLENVMQGEKQQREEKGFQEEVDVSAHRWSIRAISELRGALIREAKPSCKEIC